ncbi:DJ-1/PfpI family protein [Streptomyces sp. NBC_00053]|uniref:GlxA family transcriptional regulator n=1 Tax=unclassified Streptomyces TaxID=2593676 RepID=UPI00225B6331|nr:MULTISPECIES: DJ-1/PfpI family protein [unclassified Streptomyces]MCX5504758.1 DJ-1/PfpI family protein [Streptomyces sp. NBC_00052]MCX5546705.1 DJ-1/PfpI family protein [Streptomyces sp. NBC_00051]WSG54850.1 DJ-1/PfpI family protein [Streptomyces sp. NBC_01732]
MTKAVRHHVVVVAYDDVELVEVACVTSAFDGANRLGASPPYDVRLVAPEGRPVRCSSGLVLGAQAALERTRGPVDTLLVVGGPGHAAAAQNPWLVEHVRRLAGIGRRVASVCTGASVLAATGLLDGRRATTHWAYAHDLAQRHPAVEVDPAPLYLRDEHVCTSAGVTGALDLTLAFVEEDHGPALARTLARMMVTYLQRPGNQAQISMFVDAPAPEHRTVQRTVEHITGHLDGDLSATALAAYAGVSGRHLARLFLDNLGQTPAQFVRTARAEAASQLLVSTALPLASIARRCGFSSAEAMRQVFLDHYGTTPSQHRTVHSAPRGAPPRSDRD